MSSSCLKLPLLILVGVTLLSTACAKQTASISANLMAYNHSLSGVASFEVSLSNGSTVQAGYIAPGAGGGSHTCCIMLPVAWTPTLTATVRKVSTRNGQEQTFVQKVAIPRYDGSLPNHLSVHFLNDDSVKVFITDYLLGHQKYPLRGKEAEMVPGVPLEIRWK